MILKQSLSLSQRKYSKTFVVFIKFPKNSTPAFLKTNEQAKGHLSCFLFFCLCACGPRKTKHSFFLKYRKGFKSLSRVYTAR